MSGRLLHQKKPSPPQSGVTHPDTSLLRPQLAMEYEWLEKVTVTDGPVDVTWSAHHASQKRGKPFEVSITSLLPLLRDQAHSVATVKHVMDKIKEIVAFLNPGQVPVIAADQPIYAVAKQVQWHWLEKSTSLAELIPYFFANNNVNYARWLPIYYRDMVTL
ncbi:hypothetical protein AAFF_G00309950 [Aldrovandia affinis]|uniref:Uncharacterized protein n=1 Tax=Aldrovandia affinis TaxID=143900 RepID=A0AAD7WR23_9TELE|nr:hypothetical protein AAFF_G00309950 [Aldrovandia affinis]